MIEAVFLHAPDDAQTARMLVSLWPGARAIAVDPSTGPVTTGRDILMIGVWTGRGDFAAVRAALMSAPRRAVVLALDPAPAEIARLGVWIIGSSGEHDADVAALAQTADNLRRGIYPLPEAAPAPARARKQPPAKRERAPAPRPRASGLADPQQEEQRRRRRRSAVGFAFGAALGLALFFGFAAPQLGAWLNRRDAPPPIVVAPREAAAAPAVQDLAPPPPEPPALRGRLEDGETPS